MKGLIHLKIQNFKEEIIAAADAKLYEMRNLLAKNLSVSDFQKNEFYSITPSKFLEISSSEEFSKMCEAYNMYKEFKKGSSQRITKQISRENQRDWERLRILQAQGQEEEIKKRLLNDRIAEEERRRLLEQQKFHEEYRLKLLEIQREENEKERKRLEAEAAEKQERLKRIQEEEDQNKFESGLDAKMLKDFEEEGERLLSSNRANVFKDQDFEGDEAVNGGYGTSNYGISDWKRIKDMKDDKGNKITNPVVISDGLGANDIGQGQLGD